MPKNKRNKRKKRLWRNIQINELDGLSKRVEKELAGTLKDPSTKKDHELFVIDRVKKVLTPQQRKDLARGKVLSVYSRIDPYPHLKPKTSIQKKKKRVTTGTLTTKKLKLLKKFKHQKVDCPQQPQQPQQQTPEGQNFDIWADPIDPRDIFIEKFPEVEKEYLEVKKVKVHKKIIPSLLPAVDIPTQGASYNPDPNEHVKLLKAAVDEQIQHRQELNKLKQRLKAEPYRPSSTLPEVDFIPGENITYNSSDESEHETTNDDEPTKVYQSNVPIKTKTERNREARRKEGEALHKKKLLLKEKNKRMALIEMFKAEIEAHQQNLQVRAEHKKLKQEQEPYKTKKLGSEKFEEEDIQVLLPNQLPAKFSHIKTHLIQ